MLLLVAAMVKQFRVFRDNKVLPMSHVQLRRFSFNPFFLYFFRILTVRQSRYDGKGKHFDTVLSYIASNFFMITIYHNPRCSKSIATLALLKEHNVEPRVVKYLDNPPSAATLREIANMLGGSIRDIIRRGEPLYRQLNLHDRPWSEAELLDLVATNPRLLQRPIVVSGERAAVGRPPQNVLSIL